MSILDILKYPDPFLKTVAGPVERVDEEVRKLISDMVDTMYAARGIGLAAVQVGVAKRVVVLDVPTDDEETREPGRHLIALVNPVITSLEGTMVYEEGCLSVPGYTADVTRAERVTVQALNGEGKEIELTAEGLPAIAIQHEIDHLDGFLFIDRISRLKRELIKRKIKKALEAESKAL